MPEDYEPRFAFEKEPEKLVDKYTLRSRHDLWTDGHWHLISERYSQMASYKVKDEALEWLEKNSKDKKAIDELKAEERAKRMKRK